MDVRILGEVELASGETLIRPRGRERAVLVCLALRANRVVPRDALVEALWGVAPPPSATAALQVHVSRLRKLLHENGGPPPLVTRAGGYMLELDPARVDAFRFAALVESGSGARADGKLAEASESLEAALALWRGPPLVELDTASWVQAELARLEELHVRALEERAEIELVRGRHAEVAPELARLVAQWPLRERLRGQLMLALYRCGRQSEALQVFADGRHALADELGLEPGGALRALEAAILRQDPSLEPAAPPPARAEPPPPRHRRRRLWPLLLAAAAAAAAIVAAAVVASRNSPGGPPVLAPQSVVAIDLGSGRLAATVPIGGIPTGLAVAAGSLWVTDFSGRTLVRIDPRRRVVTKTIALPAPPIGIAAGFGSVWVVSRGQPALVRVDARYADLVARVPIRQRGLGRLATDRGANAVAVGLGSVWLAHGLSAVSRLEPGARTPSAQIVAGPNPVAVAAGEGAVWAVNEGPGTVVEIDPVANALTATVPVGNVERAIGEYPYPSCGIAFAAGSVWVAAQYSNAVYQIDPLTARVTGAVRVAGGPCGVAAGGGRLWVAAQLEGALVELDPERAAVVRRIPLDGHPVDVVVVDGEAWLSTGW
jgi:DNA-binding SARP family transcriptional activator/DNA-binding beta-propeller fold protein YncE